MKKLILVTKKIKKFNHKITVEGDKSLSIRFALLASQASGKSTAYNLLRSDDVINTLNCLKKLGVKIKFKNNCCEIHGNGINSFKYKRNLVLNLGNSGTLGRLLLALLIRSPYKIKLIGDQSLSKRDFSRVILPLRKFGANFYPKNKKTLPIHIRGTNFLRPIEYFEKRASAQVKSCIMLGALNSPGITRIIAKKSRNHTEILFKYLKIPISVRKTKNFDFIKITGKQNFKSFKYTIPGDPSGSAFFVVLTLLSKNSYLIIKNVCANPYRIGYITILNKMGAKIKLKNTKIYKGEKIADIHVQSQKSLKAINCPPRLNSSAIDEFLIIFLAAAKAKGISYFSQLNELQLKESKRLDWGSKILNMIGIKTSLTGNSIKIYGKGNFKLNKNCEIKNYLKDHRVMAMSLIAGAVTSNEKNYWKIHNPESIKTSFPKFLKIFKQLGGKVY